MEIKYCPECRCENLLTAKFCMGCSEEFPKLNISKKASSTSVSPLKVTKKPKISLVVDTENPDQPIDDEEEMDGDIPVVDEDSMGNVFLQVMNSQGLLNEKPKGVKLGEAIATSNEPKIRRRPPADLPKTGKEILAQTKNVRNQD